jgi:hypothetical protein
MIFSSSANFDSRNALVADALVSATRASANVEFVFLNTTQG